MTLSERLANLFQKLANSRARCNRSGGFAAKLRAHPNGAGLKEKAPPLGDEAEQSGGMCGYYIDLLYAFSLEPIPKPSSWVATWLGHTRSGYAPASLQVKRIPKIAVVVCPHAKIRWNSDLPARV